MQVVENSLQKTLKKIKCPYVGMTRRIKGGACFKWGIWSLSWMLLRQSQKIAIKFDIIKISTTLTSDRFHSDEGIIKARGLYSIKGKKIE